MEIVFGPFDPLSVAYIRNNLLARSSCALSHVLPLRKLNNLTLRRRIRKLFRNVEPDLSSLSSESSSDFFLSQSTLNRNCFSRLGPGIGSE